MLTEQAGVMDETALSGKVFPFFATDQKAHGKESSESAEPPFY